MLDVERWMREAGVPAKKYGSMRPQSMPYVTILESCSVRGGDDENRIAERSITLELYCDADGAKNGAAIRRDAEERIELLLDASGIAYEKDGTIFIEREKMTETVYTFELTEKMEAAT